VRAAVSRIFDGATPSKIDEAVIIRVAIEMSSLKRLVGARADECLQYEVVNGAAEISTGEPQIDDPVSGAVEVWVHDERLVAFT
jgi:hypothetical protein